jgi:2EXR family
MAQPNIEQTVTVPSNLLQPLLASLNSLREDDTQLRRENNETKDAVTKIQASLETLLPLSPERGAFEFFPKLPIEIRHMIWDAALQIPRIISAKIVSRGRGMEMEDLVPMVPSSSILFVNKESRARALEGLVCWTDDFDTRTDRVPQLDINPEVDTLWVVNYDRFRAGNERVNCALFCERKFRRLAMPATTWSYWLERCPEHTDWSLLRFLAELKDCGVEEVTLVVGGRTVAECSDIVLVEPTKIPAFHMDHRWLETIARTEYSSGREALEWQICDNYVNWVFKDDIFRYLHQRGLSKESNIDSGNELDNAMVKWTQGLWKPPNFKFMEATTRKELGKLNARM